ncbi:hypothetical protein [Brevibacillus borstelensis]|uniref:hypothetical protein n=1 Tax=Brevibacillus borstelensis TaxID=45462 RepID=UPI000F07AC5C|nr:hypothetical protein [Brevibacillus borstelensis]MED1882677.1 hypothetical protein [Brevibacillus borstelensis]MED2009208.1 hypothetical protein [Brevibacillus borstelensis]RNB57573.1 hypothetical protein EDM54_22625 [Brevibacillus borstelensis]GED55024.1 hypothetical protein BBO01nite_42650 [Brevibacillus borstelensis]
MNSKLTIIGNILLTLCLLFTFTFSNAVPASAKKSKQDISIEVYSDNDILFELVAENTDRDATYSVTILQKGNQYLWKSKIDVDGKTVSKTEIKIKKIKRDFEPKELEKHLSNVLLGKEDSNELEEYINKVFIQEEKTELNNQGKVTTQAVPLLIPLAAGAISSSALATLEAALFATVATATAAVATAILEERYRYSDVFCNLKMQSLAANLCRTLPTSIPKNLGRLHAG